MIDTRKRSVGLRQRWASLHDNSGCMDTKQIFTTVSGHIIQRGSRRQAIFSPRMKTGPV